MVQAWAISYKSIMILPDHVMSIEGCAHAQNEVQIQQRVGYCEAVLREIW